MKIKTPSRAVLRPRRRRIFWFAVDCACGGLGRMLTPSPFELHAKSQALGAKWLFRNQLRDNAVK